MRRSDPIDEGARILTICNACRYCEGYCAVFPAMEHRPRFHAADLNYLANLCHNCAECYYACQYAPPHEFAVNVPQVLAQVRLRSYEQFTWPFGGSSFRRSGHRVLPAVGLSLAALLLLAAPRGADAAGGNFYAVFSHGVMVGLFGFLFGWALLVLAVGCGRFWRQTGSAVGPSGLVKAFFCASGDAARLRYLSSGGAGCTYPAAQHSSARRWFHHFTFYGFLLCFASTTVAAFYHYVLGLRAPYPLLSPPVVLGTLGGVGLLIGPLGLYSLKRRRDDAIADAAQDGMDLVFLWLLFFTGATGLLLLGLRQTGAMPVLLAVHLALVMALFLTLPYGKFVHGIYRAAALVRYAMEQSGSRESHPAGKS